MNYFQFTLTISGEELDIFAPEGWDKSGITYARDKTYWGVNKSYTLSTYRFPRKPGGGGNEIYQYYQDNGISNVNGYIGIKIERRNHQTNGYTLQFEGIIDLNPERLSIERDYVEAGFVASGKYQMFILNDEINFDINSLNALNGNVVDAFQFAPTNIGFEPIPLVLNVETVSDFTEVIRGLGEYEPDTIDPPSQGIIPFEILINTQSTVINEVGERIQLITGGSRTIYENNLSYSTVVRVASITTTSNITYLDAFFRAPTGVEFGTRRFSYVMTFNYDVYDFEDNLIETFVVDVNNPFLIGFFFSFEQVDFSWNLSTLQNKSVTVPSGGRIDWYIYAIPDYENFTSGFRLDVRSHLDFNLNLFEETSQSKTYVKSYFPHEAFTRLFQLSTAELDTSKLFYSDFFGRTISEFIEYDEYGEGSRDAIFTGWNVRGFPNKPFNISWRKLFQSFDCVYNLMCYYDFVNDRIRIEKKEHAFQSDYIMGDIGEVTELVIKPMKEGYFNNIVSGFVNTGEYEEFQGVNDVHVQTEHAINLPVKDDMNVRALYNFSSISMELTRRLQYSQNASKDTKQDEQIYIVRTDGNDTIQGGSTAQGGSSVLSGFNGIENYYNLMLTPRENLLRWGNILKVALWKDVVKVKFISSSKKVNIQYLNQNNDIVNEFDDISEADLPDIRLFNPEWLEFEGTFPDQLRDNIELNPHGIINFTFDGIGYAGFIDLIETMEYEGKAKYKLFGTVASQNIQKVFMDGSDALFMDGQNHLLM